MTEDNKLGCGCITMIVLVVGVYYVIHLLCPSLDFMQMTGFAWVPSIIVIAVVHNIFESVSTTKSGDQEEGGSKCDRCERERLQRERERLQRERDRIEKLKPHVDSLKKKFHTASQDEERGSPRERMREGAEEGRAREREAKAKQREERFLRYLFSMLAKLAKADGHVDASEVKVAEKVFDRFDFAARRRKFCTGVFNEAKDNSRSIYWYAEQFGEQVDDESVCTFVYELLWDVACADGWLHPAEKEILRIICSKLRIPEAYYHINYRRRFGTFREGEKNADGKQEGGQTGAKSRREWRRPYVSGRSTILEAYEILECDSSATIGELKASFHKVAKRYHPDLLRSNGVPEEMIKAATEKMAQINAAWEDIRRVRGI